MFRVGLRMLLLNIDSKSKQGRVGHDVSYRRRVKVSPHMRPSRPQRAIVCGSEYMAILKSIPKSGIRNANVRRVVDTRAMA